MNEFLELDNVGKAYGDLTVLSAVTMSVAVHEIVCMIGASGSGKSTLLRCINALEPINKGEIRLDGGIISGPGTSINEIRRVVGMVFQSYNMFPHMSVLENIIMAPMRVRGTSKKIAEERAFSLLERVGLADKAGAYPFKLSGGQQQRAAIVRSLAMEPRVLLLDEVTSALDPYLVGEVLDLIRSLADDGLTMLLATHEMEFAREVGSRIVFLNDGRICESGTPADILDNAREPETQHFLARVMTTRRG